MARTEVTGSQIRDSSVSLTADVTGILPVVNGGTGSNTIALNNVMLGNGTGAVQTVAPGAAGNVLKSNGTTWTSGTAGPAAGSYPRVYAPDSGRWLRAGGGSLQANHYFTAAYIRAVRLYVPATLSFDRICVNVSVAASGNIARLGVYDTDSNGLPSSLVFDAGSISCATTGLKEIVISQTLTAGWYYAALGGAGGSYFAVTGDTGLCNHYSPSAFLVGSTDSIEFNGGMGSTLPSTFTVNSSGPSHVGGPRIMLRVA